MRTVYILTWSEKRPGPPPLVLSQGPRYFQHTYFCEQQLTGTYIYMYRCSHNLALMRSAVAVMAAAAASAAVASVAAVADAAFAAAAVAVDSVSVVPAVAAVAIGLAVDCVVAVVAMSAVARGALLTEGGGSKRPHSFPKQFRLRNHST